MTEKYLAYYKPYFVITGPGKDHAYDVYLVVNENTKIVEYETRLLPQALSIAEQLAGSLAAQQDSSISPKVELAVVS